MAEPDPAAPVRELPLMVIGVDHHRTPVEVRERLAVDAGALDGLLAALAALPGGGEAVVVSTCNRLECYLGGSPDRRQVLTLLAERQGLDTELLDRHLYHHQGRHGVRHLFRVVSGLESLVIGEYQIVHQIKTAYDQAQSAKVTGPLLNPLFQRALAVAKDVRNQTAIGKHKLSVASVAVDLAKHIHGELSQARLLVVGAGEIAELAVKYLVSAGVRRLSIVNRSPERAAALAAELTTTDFKPEVLPWSALGEALAAHDIVVSSTAAPHAVILASDVRSARKRRRSPLMLIDLAVPRDVEPAVAGLDDVYLYNIDHLDAVVASNRQLRVEEVDAAAALVDTMVASYATDVRHDKAALLAQVAGYFQDVVAAEEVRLRTKLGLADSADLRYGLERVGNKLQHQVLKYLREHAGDPQAERAVRAMLGLMADG